MKKFLPLYIILGLMITFVGGFSHTFAKFSPITQTKEQYCKPMTICGTASKPLTMMLDFTTEMINAIHTQGTEGDYLGKYVNPNRFEGNDFNPPKQGIVGRLARNITQKLKFGIASTAIFANPVNVAGIKSFLGSFVLLFKNRIFFRDAQLIEETESLLAQKKYELGAGGGWFENVNADNLVILRTILQKYIDEGLFTSDSHITDDVLYNNITSLLTQILSAAKTFLYIETTTQFDTMSRGTNDKIVVTFDGVAMSYLTADYGCAQGFDNPCDSSIKKFIANMKNLSSSTSGSRSASREMVTDAVARLGELFSKKPSDDFKARESELLRSMYGNRTITSKRFSNPLKIKYDEQNGSVKDFGAIGDVAATIVRSRKQSTANKEVTTASEELANTIENATEYTMSADEFSKIMRGYADEVFVNQAIDVSLADFGDVKDVTPAFSVIGDQINAIKEYILGGKDKQKSLLGSLGKACELQCGRGGRCY